MRPRWRTLLAATVMAITVMLTVAVAMIDRGTGIKDYAFIVMFASAFTFLGLVGGVLTIKRPGNVLGWLLLLGAMGVIAGATADSAYTAFAGPEAPVTTALLTLGATTWVPGAVALLVIAPLVFPTGRVPSPRWRWVGWFGVATAALLLVPLVAAVLRDPAVLARGWEGIDAEGPALQSLADMGLYGMLAAAVLAWVSLVVRFRRAHAEERQQLKWFVFAIALTVAYTIFSNSPAAAARPWLDVAAGAVALPSSGVAIGIAVLRYRLYDIDRIISRTLSYALLTAMLAGVYLAGVLLLAPLLGRGSDLAVAGSTLAAAAAFQPLRRRVQAVVDRRFNRARYDAQRTVEVFAARLRDEVDLDELRTELVGVVRRSVEPAATSLWLREETLR